jgi:signal transduction histidine kinase
MQRHVGKLATMEFENLLPVSGNDELTSLALSINRMAMDLQRATQLIRMSERTTLITQVAGGLAHQLRNSITGARMAIQLQMRRSPNSDVESLRVANRQLSLTENQIRGLLSLTRDAQQEPVSGQIDQILGTIHDLLEPQFRHSTTNFEMVLPAEQPLNSLTVADADQIQSALLNLIQNALEACRPDGQVRVLVSLSDDQILVDVLDNGPGIADHVKDRIFEPFVTGKPEGVGLGLTLAAQVAESADGKLTCDRIDHWTRFRFQIRRLR